MNKTEAEFKKAYERCLFYRSLYASTPFGIFGLGIINDLISRYKNGERTLELYEAMMSVE